MKNQTRKNFLSGIARLVTEKQTIERETPKIYHSLHTFFHEHPIPKEGADKNSMGEFYNALLNLNSAYLPIEQRPIRSNLLVEVGIYSGIIKLNRGANL